MSRTFLTIAALGLAAFVAGCAVQSEDGASTAPTLDVTTSTAEALTGTFAQAGSLISFDSKLVAAGRSELALEVNGATFNFVRDANSQTASYDGHNAALTQQDVAALNGLSEVLGARKDFRQMTEAEAILTRAVAMLSEAPVGLTLGQRNMTRTQPSVVSQKLAYDTAVADGVEAAVPPADEGKIDPIANPGEEQNQATQSSDEDGVLYYGSCAYTTRTVCFDGRYWNFSCNSRMTGAGDVCRGKCGPGCGGVGTLPFYTYDCGDHDWCLYFHGGSSLGGNADCGDEFYEADDDYMLGWPMACAW